MKKYIIKAILLITILTLTLPAAARKSIAIVDFNDSGSEIKGMNMMVREQLSGLIHELGRLTIVEREKMNAVLKEHELNASGVVDEETAVKFGGILGVNYLLFGDIVQGTISAPALKTRQNYMTDKTGKKTPTTFEVWEEITCLTSIAIRIVNVKNGTVKYTKTYNQKNTKKINFKRYKRKENYLTEVRTEKKYLKKASIIAILTGQEKEVNPDSIGPENKAILTTTLGQNVLRFRRDLFFEFPLEGVIIKIIDKKTVMIDLGSADGAKENTRLDVIRVHAPVKHPTTGKMLENRETLDGKLKIIVVDGPETSRAKGSKGFIASLQVGDLVISRRQLVIPR